MSGHIPAVRVTEDCEQRTRDMAALCGQSLSDYVRDIISQGNRAVAVLDHEFWLTHMARKVANQWGVSPLSPEELAGLRAAVRGQSSDRGDG